MTEKQQLLLYLIAKHPFLREIYQLVKVFDRASFPAKVSEDLRPLIGEELIEVAELFDNNTPKNYRVTNKGLDYLNETIKVDNLIQYVKTLDDPSQLLMALKN